MNLKAHISFNKDQKKEFSIDSKLLLSKLERVVQPNRTYSATSIHVVDHTNRPKFIMKHCVSMRRKTTIITYDGEVTEGNIIVFV